jgi:RNA polymerase sigma factor (sigma-70 family)
MDPGDQESEGSAERRPARCSFCRKSDREVGPLVEGPDGVAICGDCIELCQSILDQERERKAGRDGYDEGPIDAATEEMLNKELDSRLEILSELEREVVKLRYGLTDGYTYTLDEVCSRLGITRASVRKIEARAVAMLRSQNRLPPYP